MTTKKRAVITLADMPAGTVAKIQGNDFPQFKGLLPLAHQHGLQSFTSDLVMFEAGNAVVKAKISGSRGEYEAHGDACPKNVPRGAEHEVIRRAETRAFSRALRLYLGIGDCAADEVHEGESAENASQGKQTTQSTPNHVQASQSNQRPSQHQQGASFGSAGDGGKYVCPACGARVWDNRQTAKGKQPLFRCSAGALCSGGKGSFAWGSWDPDFFEKSARESAHIIPDSEPRQHDAMLGDLDGMQPPPDQSRDQEAFRPISDDDIPF